jgi:hypothetical protein
VDVVRRDEDVSTFLLRGSVLQKMEGRAGIETAAAGISCSLKEDKAAIATG